MRSFFVAAAVAALSLVGVSSASAEVPRDPNRVTCANAKAGIWPTYGNRSMSGLVRVTGYGYDGLVLAQHMLGPDVYWSCDADRWVLIG